jgi:hypothetical protein
MSVLAFLPAARSCFDCGNRGQGAQHSVQKSKLFQRRAGLPERRRSFSKLACQTSSVCTPPRAADVLRRNTSAGQDLTIVYEFTP